ncbi:MAG: phytanoyl-CoA dioxygenase family protein [Pseudomonadota bacterium]|nr:phytanoyl-CoA dioxygenase family protein [Pseudomonadota bacterium]
MNAAQDLYPSRVEKEENILERVDPVVYGRPEPEREHALSDAQMAFFEDNGYLVLPDWLPDMVDPVREELTHLKRKLKGREELVLEPDSGNLRSIFAVHEHSEMIAEVARHPKVLNLVQQILGSDVYIMQSRVNIKPAFRGKSFPWHSDFETWHVEDGMPRMRAVTAWLMLDENTEFNGPLYVIPGSHKHFVSCEGKTEQDNHKQSLRQQMAGVPSPESIEALTEKGLKGIYGKPGTLVIHECNLLHGSPDNISPWPRSIAMFVFNSVENRNQRPFSGLRPRPDYLSSSSQEPVRTASEET